MSLRSLVNLLSLWLVPTAMLTKPIYAANLSTSEIIAAVETQQLKSVAELLEWVEQVSPEFFGDFTLMRKSGSLQQATSASPRAIIYGKDAKLIMTFNGNDDQVGGNSVELVEFAASPLAASSWNFREIIFSASGTAVVSENNPGKCMRCHGTKLRPLWEPYDNWPGAYGADDDALSSYSAASIKKSSQPEKMIAANKVRQNFLTFKNSAARHPRYRHLRFVVSEDSSVAPYTDRKRSGSYPLRPNLQLSKLLAELNAQALAKQAGENQACFAAAAPALISEMLGCGNIDSVAADYRKKIQDYKSLPTEMKDRLVAQGAWTRFSSNQKNHFRISLLNLIGIERNDWQMGPSTKGWVYFKGFDNQYDDFLEKLIALGCDRGRKWLSYRAVRRENYSSYYDNSDATAAGNDNCDSALVADYSYEETTDEVESYPNDPEIAASVVAQLCEKLLPEILPLTEVKASCEKPQADVDRGDKLQRLCTSCHGKTGKGPWINFSEPTKLGAAAKQRIWQRINSAEPQRRMPPDRPLSYEEKYQWHKYLNH